MKYRQRNYFVYILTNKNKTVLYIGVTWNIGRRLAEHQLANTGTFSGKYNLHYLIYWKHFISIADAIQREKEIKKWNRSKKEGLINTTNPGWDFLNHLV